MIDPTLDALIRLRIGAQRYGVFFSTGEGSFYPDGTEESSGFVVTEAGTHYSYWTGWAQGHRVFKRWEWIVGEDDWRSDPEYLDARRDAGLVPD